jgi:hypothetical protein
MDNFICWRSERDGQGAFMLMGRSAEKWLVERKRQEAHLIAILRINSEF